MLFHKQKADLMIAVSFIILVNETLYIVLQLLVKILMDKHQNRSKACLCHADCLLSAQFVLHFN